MIIANYSNYFFISSYEYGNSKYVSTTLILHLFFLYTIYIVLEQWRYTNVVFPGPNFNFNQSLAVWELKREWLLFLIYVVLFS